MNSLSESKNPEKPPNSQHETEKNNNCISIEEDQLDEAAKFSLDRTTLNSEDASRVRKKIDKVILPMMCSKYLDPPFPLFF